MGAWVSQTFPLSLSLGLSLGIRLVKFKFRSFYFRLKQFSFVCFSLDWKKIDDVDFVFIYSAMNYALMGFWYKVLSYQMWNLAIQFLHTTKIFRNSRIMKSELGISKHNYQPLKIDAEWPNESKINFSHAPRESLAGVSP